jgi:predicted GNAT superfamily acetyltransferase
MNTDRIEIRTAHTHTDCRHVQVLQQRVWESRERDLVPSHVLITIVKNGGVLLGAFAPDGPRETGGMVGFVFGWPGYSTDKSGRTVPKHCSHQLAVLPDYQRQGLGRRLKLAQREAVMAQGTTEWITWTFDPLQRVNAIFNLHRLGASSNTYVRNAYGELDDAINIGLPTDRLQVDWWLRSPRVLAAIAADQGASTHQLDKLTILSAPSMDVAEVPNLSGSEEAASLAVPLPESADSLRSENPTFLAQWRFYLRAVLPAAFERGYQLTDCVPLPNAGWHYILSPR